MPANIYKLKNGTIVPGVTTIINQLDKPALIDWAWKLGKEGKNWREERDSAGDIGTLVHEEVMKILSTNDTTATSANPIVFNCIKKFMLWWAEQVVRGMSIKLIEQPLVSEKLAYGGQPDIYVEVESKKRLIDIKTSGGIYDSYWLQLAGYGILLKENGYPVDEYQILWLPKDNRFDAPIRTDLRREKKIFKNLLEIYKLRRG